MIAFSLAALSLLCLATASPEIDLSLWMAVQSWPMSLSEIEDVGWCSHNARSACAATILEDGCHATGGAEEERGEGRRRRRKVW
jgi:hypothetical protein